MKNLAFKHILLSTPFAIVYFVFANYSGEGKSGGDMIMWLYALFIGLAHIIVLGIISFIRNKTEMAWGINPIVLLFLVTYLYLKSQ